MVRALQGQEETSEMHFRMNIDGPIQKYISPPFQHAEMMPFNPEPKNIGLLWAKVRRFCIKSTEVLCKEVRCFCSSEANVFDKREQSQACLGYAESRQRKTKSRRKVKPNTKAKPTYAFSPHKNIFLLKSPTFPTPGMENPNKTWQSRVKDWV